jgi:hypothetical protein
MLNVRQIDAYQDLAAIVGASARQVMALNEGARGFRRDAEPLGNLHVC